MLRKNLSKIVGVSAIALSATVMPLTLPASAQVVEPGVGVEREAEIYENDDDGFDWGWLGLIGLAGLAGLAGKKRQEPTAYRDPGVTTTSTYRD